MSHIDGIKLLKRRGALLEQEPDRVRGENQLEAGRQAMASKAACHSAPPLRPKRHLGGSMRLLLLLLLVSCTALAQAKKTGPKPVKPRVIKESSRIVPRTQMPDHWITWTNRGSDCVLMASVWKVLVLPEVPKMLNKCRKPLCKMLKSIARKKGILSPKRFTKCTELAKLLGYNDIDAAGTNGYHAIPTMARLLLTLSDESDYIKERFQAVSDVTRFCDDQKETKVLSLPFIIVQQLNYDYIRDGDNLFVQAACRSENQTLREQHQYLADLLIQILAEERLGRAAGLRDKNFEIKEKFKNFFICQEGQKRTLSFRLRRMNKTATHAVFLISKASRAWLDSQELLRTDPDTAGYPGQVSLETNRAVWFQVPETRKTQKDHRLWELYSCSLSTLITPEASDSDVNNVEPIRHMYPQWYPHGAQKRPGEAICNTFERQEEQQFESIYTAERCNRNASAQSMAFVATRREGSAEPEKTKSDRGETILEALADFVKGIV